MIGAFAPSDANLWRALVRHAEMCPDDGLQEIRRFGFVPSVTAMGIASSTWDF